MNTVDLSEEDKKRINDTDFYHHAKTIMESFQHYQCVNVGEVYSIIYRNYSDKPQYVSRGKSPDKYMVINKDNGFVFAKRIKSDGSLSKNIVCLTIRFPQPNYTIELDAEQAESIIFQDEGSFDPFKQGKELTKKKNKVRRLNRAKVVIYNTAQEAFAFISTLKIGDTLFDAGTSFGEGVVEWQVSNIENRPVDKTPVYDWKNIVYAHGKTSVDQVSNTYQLNTVINITLKIVSNIPSSRRWLSGNRDISFVDFLVCKERYKDWYVTRPTTTDEV